MSNIYGKKINKSVEFLFSEKNLANKKALDLGCSNGVNSLFLANNGANVDAIDIDADVEFVLI